MQEYAPKFMMDDINLPEKREAPVTTGTGDIMKDALGGKSFPITSGYDPKRKLSPHYAVDIGAPSGTPVMALPLGVSWRVDKVGNNATENAGLNMTLSTEVNGHTVKMRVMHLQHGSMKYKAGDTVGGGAVIAAVGNTGRTKGHGEKKAHIWEPGRTAGAHLHLEVTVDKKKVDPRKLYEVIGVEKSKEKQRPAQQPAPQAPQQPPTAPAPNGKQTLAEIFSMGAVEGWRRNGQF